MPYRITRLIYIDWKLAYQCIGYLHAAIQRWYIIHFQFVNIFPPHLWKSDFIHDVMISYNFMT